MSQAYSVGKEIIHHCPKCQLDLAHMIVSMIGDNIDRISCKTCKSTRKFRSKNKKAIPRKLITKKINKQVSSDFWLESVSKAESFKTYSPVETFSNKDFLRHPSFGDGFVTKIMDSHKMEVLFRTGYKILIYGK